MVLVWFSVGRFFRVVRSRVKFDSSCVLGLAVVWVDRNSLVRGVRLLVRGVRVVRLSARVSG